MNDLNQRGRELLHLHLIPCYLGKPGQSLLRIVFFVLKAAINHILYSLVWWGKQS
ncbi:MAG: hypothetical protein KA314_18420 [Chloroflexi bacterium]|nr:hypothetical protein [Chloroflexota bacterium]MBP8057807.1 hypothetical protein [Chloroflexota bacterium]